MSDELTELRERRRRAAERRRECGGDYIEAIHDVVSHRVPWEGTTFGISAQQEDLIDFATPASGTYPLTPETADALAAALMASAAEVRRRRSRSETP